MLIRITLINVRIVVTFYIIKKYRTYSESLTSRITLKFRSNIVGRMS